MISYAQFCPVAKTAEVFGDRWTPIIIPLPGYFAPGSPLTTRKAGKFSKVDVISTPPNVC
jgi:hypothetical protein